MRKRTFKQSLTSVILLSLMGLIALLMLGSCAIGYYEFTHTLEKQYAATANMLANAGSRIVNTNTLSWYLRTGEKDDVYLAAESRLQNLTDTSGSYVMYVAQVDEQGGHRKYIYNVVGEKSGFTPYEIGYEDNIGEEFLSAYHALLDDASEQTNYTYSRSSSSIGAYTTTIAPLYDKNGSITAVCGVVLPMKALTEGRRNYLLQMGIWALLLSVAAGAGWFYMMRLRLVQPLRKIADEALRFSSEGRIAVPSLKEQLTSHSEIGELAQVVDQMEVTLVDNVEKLLDMTAERNRIAAELGVAAAIQSNILPEITESFPGRKEFELSAYMKPAREVGGDFYDFYFVDKDHFAMVIADVSGKGIPAALFMMISKVLIKSECMRGNFDPGSVLTEVNRKLCENNKIDMFVTVWLGILELSTGSLVCSNAGHEYPVLCKRDGFDQLFRDPHGFVLGGMDGVREKNYTLHLEKGDTLFVYTDGVPEAENEKQEQFGTDRLLAALQETADAGPGERIAAVNQALAHFSGEAEQFDDTTMLCIKYHG